MKKLNKKGFTLIELMIVLAIIAILAVVLIPKAGSMKDSTKNTGVASNVNNIRAYLETKVTDKGNYVNTSGATALRTSLSAAFLGTGTNAITNPFNKTTSVGSTAAGTTDASDSINVVDNTTGTTNTVALLMATMPTANANNKGIAYVYVCTDGFVVFGFDSAGAIVGAQGVN